MLFSVGMYLPLETTFAIFVGGMVRGIMDKMRDKRGFNDAQKARVENAGVLAASGLIAGEALMGLVVAAVVGLRSEHAFWSVPGRRSRSRSAPGSPIPVAAFLIWYLIAVPLAQGRRGRRASPADRRHVEPDPSRARASPTGIPVGRLLLGRGSSNSAITCVSVHADSPRSDRSGDPDLAAPRPVELDEVDGLPAAELQLARATGSGTDTPITEERKWASELPSPCRQATAGTQLLEGGQQVRADVGVGVLVEHHGRRGVRHEDVARAPRPLQMRPPPAGRSWSRR